MVNEYSEPVQPLFDSARKNAKTIQTATSVIKWFGTQLKTKSRAAMVFTVCSDELIKQLSNSFGEIGWLHSWSSADQYGSTMLEVWKAPRTVEQIRADMIAKLEARRAENKPEGVNAGVSIDLSDYSSVTYIRDGKEVIWNGSEWVDKPENPNPILMMENIKFEKMVRDESCLDDKHCEECGKLLKDGYCPDHSCPGAYCPDCDGDEFR